MRTHQLVLAHVEAELAAGRLTLGGRLPGERVLAEQLGISRPSVREAIRALEVLGVVRTATGSGPEAGAVIVADPAAGLGVALRLHVATSGVAVGDVVQLRLLLETWAVREAAGKPDDTVLADAAVLLDRMDAEPDPDRFLDLDGDFHAGPGRPRRERAGHRGDDECARRGAVLRRHRRDPAARLDRHRPAVACRTPPDPRRRARGARR